MSDHQSSGDGDAETVRSLIDDAEKSKSMLDSMLPVFEKVGFIDELVEDVTARLREEMEKRLAVSSFYYDNE